MEKKLYMAPESEEIMIETCGMLAASGIEEGEAQTGGENNDEDDGF